MFAIIGAGGNIGGTVARALRAVDQPVRVVLRDPARGADLAAIGCEIAVADVNDAPALAEAIKGADVVHAMLPIAPQASDAGAAMRASVDSLAGALAIAAPAHVLAISDYGAELATGTGVTLSFHYLETRLRELPNALTFVRSAEHMQNWRRQVPTAVQTGVLASLHQPLAKAFPTVFSPDVGQICADLLVAGHLSGSPRIVHVEGPRRYTALDVAATLSEVGGREVVARELPRAEWPDALRRGGLGASYAGLVTDLYDAHNAGRIDAEPGVGEVRRGATELRDVLSRIVRTPA